MFVLIVASVFVLLSQWQFSRSLEKDVAPPSVTEKVQPLIETLNPGEPLMGSSEGQLVSMTGHFDPSKQVVVDSRLQEGEKGFWAVAAFVVDGAKPVKGETATEEVVIPVARGWIKDAQAVPALPTGQLQIEGRLLNSEGPILNTKPRDGIVGSLSAAELTNRWNVTTYAAFVISYKQAPVGADLNTAQAQDGLTAITVTAADQNKVNWLSIFYAIEWVLFAGFALFIWWRLVADDFRREQDELYGLDDDDPEDSDPEDLTAEDSKENDDAGASAAVLPADGVSPQATQPKEK